MEKAESENEPEPSIAEDLLTEFKELYKDEFGVELSDEEALARALNLRSLFKAIYRPMPVEPGDHQAGQQAADRPGDNPPAASGEKRQLRLF